MSVMKSVEGFCNVVVWLSMLTAILSTSILIAGVLVWGAVYVWQSVALTMGGIW